MSIEKKHGLTDKLNLDKKLGAYGSPPENNKEMIVTHPPTGKSIF